MSDLLIVILVFLSILVVILSTARWKINAFFSLITVSIILALITPGPSMVSSVLKDGFGSTLGAIGLIIVFGTCLGVLLDKSGATHGMANFILRFVKKEKSTRAIAITGTLTGLPIFCDSGFVVLSGLNRSLSERSGITIGRMAATLAISLYTLHCFIPPHPGITAAAGIMNGNIGELVLFGTLIAIPGVIVGYLWVRFMSHKEIIKKEESRESFEVEPIYTPSAFLSFLPVILPLFLISLDSLNVFLSEGEHNLFSIITGFTGTPAIALFIGVMVAIIILPPDKRKNTDAYLVEGIEKSGPILLITAAGGTFGAVIRATGMGEIFSEALSITHLGLFVPYLLAFLMKTAQGSSTVAAITASSIAGPLMPSLGLDSETGILLGLLALGAGTIAISHTNDSFFWVVTKFSGISPKVTLKLFSTTTIVVSLFCFILIYTISLLIN